MIKALQRFKIQDDGTITVDWTVLTAGVIGLAVSAAALVEAGAVETGQSTFVGVEVANGD